MPAARYPTPARHQTVKEYFSCRSDYWDSLYTPAAESPNFTAFELKKRKDIVFDLIVEPGPDRIRRVLDLGCGAGHYLVELAQRGFDCTGADVSPSMLDLARKKLAEAAFPDVPLIQADCCALPFADSSFDLVLCIGLMEYLEDDSCALREIKRVLRPGGFAVVTFPNFYKLRNLLNPYYYLVRIWSYLSDREAAQPVRLRPADEPMQLNFGKSTVRRYSLPKIRRMAAANGLRILGLKSYCFGPFSVWRKSRLPVRTSIQISNRIEKLSSLKPFGFLKHVANRWVVLLTADAPATERAAS